MMKLKLCLLLLLLATIKNSTTTKFDNILMIEQSYVYGSECTKFSNNIESFINDYNILIDQTTLSCQLHLTSLIKKLKITVDTKMLKKLTQYLNDVEMMRKTLNDIQEEAVQITTVKCMKDMNELELNLTKVMDIKVKNLTDINSQLITAQKDLLGHSGIVSAIQMGDICAAQKFWNSSKNSLNQLIPEIYEKNLANVELFLNFLDSLSNKNDIILGYYLIYAEMLKHNNVYNVISTRIAYRALNDFTFANENNIKLKNNLVPSFRNIPWQGLIRIKSVKFEENLIDYDYLLDKDRRYVLTTSLNAARCTGYPTCCQWDLYPKNNGTYFYLKTVYYNEYLYADRDDYAQDESRRRVLTWTPKNELETQRWQFEPIENSEYFFKIKNVYWNEYLFIEDGFKHVSYADCRHVFTSRTGGCDHDGCKWRISSV